MNFEVINHTASVNANKFFKRFENLQNFIILFLYKIAWRERFCFGLRKIAKELGDV